jgi:hypothetical protein
MLPDDLSQLLGLPLLHLKEQLARDKHALQNFLERRFLPDSDIPQEWVDDLRKLITAIKVELERRERL